LPLQRAAPRRRAIGRNSGALRERSKYQAALEGGHDVLVVVLISEVWGGFSPEAMRFLGELAQARNDGIDIERASTTWSTSSFTSYHGQLLSLAVQWGVAIEIERAIKKNASFHLIYLRNNCSPHSPQQMRAAVRRIWQRELGQRLGLERAPPAASPAVGGASWIRPEGPTDKPANTRTNGRDHARAFFSDHILHGNGIVAGMQRPEGAAELSPAERPRRRGRTR
jgi:hypothetical protein